MKKQVKPLLLTTVLTAFLCSCVSTMVDKEMTPQEKTGTRVIGTVTGTITTFQPLHILNRDSVKAKAYRGLMKIAQQKYKEYQGNIEIRNITIKGRLYGVQAAFIAGGSVLGILSGIALAEAFGEYRNIGYMYTYQPNVPLGLGVGISLALVTNLIGNFQRVTVTGDVVLIDSAPGGNANNVPAPGGSTDNTPAPGANY